MVARMKERFPILARQPRPEARGLSRVRVTRAPWTSVESLWVGPHIILYIYIDLGDSQPSR